jgi:hypothetical protein
VPAALICDKIRKMYEFFAKKLTCSQKTGRIFTGEKGIVTKAIN